MRRYACKYFLIIVIFRLKGYNFDLQLNNNYSFLERRHSDKFKVIYMLLINQPSKSQINLLISSMQPFFTFPGNKVSVRTL